MIAFCPKCQVHYEVTEEHLQSGTPIVCPTCEVELTFVDPAPQIQKDQVPAVEDVPEEATVPDVQPETQEPSSPVPSGSLGSSWGSADMLFGAASPAQAPAPIQEPEQSFQLQETLLPGGSPGAPGQVPGQVPEKALEQALENALGQALEQVSQPSDLAEKPAPDLPKPPTAESWSTPAEPEVVRNTPMASPADNFQTPMWGTAMPPAQPSAQAPAQVLFQPPSGPIQGQKDSLAPQAGSDWADAAARWAASGFSTANMPDFVKFKQESPTPPNDPQSQLTQQPQPTQQSMDAQAPEKTVSKLDAMEQQFFDEPPEEPFVRTITPPPLPKGQFGGPATSLTPPPLGERQRTTFVMRGTGEGHREENVPWANATESSPNKDLTPRPASVGSTSDLASSRMQLPTIIPEMDGTAGVSQPPEASLPKAHHTVLWVVLLIVLLGAGGFAAYYFVQHYKFIEDDSAGDGLGSQAGLGISQQPEVVAKTKDGGAPVSSDAGMAQADGQATASGESSSTETTGTLTARNEDTSGSSQTSAGADGEKPKKDLVAKKDTKIYPQKALNFYRDANNLYKKKRFSQAIAKYKQALSADPSFAQAHKGLGICYAQLKNFKKACQEYRMYMKMLPPDHKEVPVLKAYLKDCK